MLRNAISGEFRFDFNLNKNEHSILILKLIILLFYFFYIALKHFPIRKRPRNKLVTMVTNSGSLAIFMVIRYDIYHDYPGLFKTYNLESATLGYLLFCNHGNHVNHGIQY